MREGIEAVVAFVMVIALMVTMMAVSALPVVMALVAAKWLGLL
jgi:hypothetical protein